MAEKCHGLRGIEGNHGYAAFERNRRRVTLVGRGVGSRRVSMAVERVGSQLGPPLATFRGPHHRAFVVPEHEGRSWLTSLHHALIKT